MSKKTLILPLPVVYTLIHETEGVGEHFYKFPWEEVTFLEVYRIQHEQQSGNHTGLDWILEASGCPAEGQDFDNADGASSDCNGIGNRLLDMLKEKGLSLSSVIGLDGQLLYKKSVNDEPSFVAKTKRFYDWHNKVATKFEECAFDVAKNSEEYDYIMDDIEKWAFDETIDYVSSPNCKTPLNSLPCVVCAFNTNDEE